MIVFIIYALAITIINNAPVVQALMGMRTLLRYIPLFYVLAFINFEESFPRKILLSILIIAGIQCSLAVYQHYAGIAEMWYPRASDLEIAGKQVTFRLLASGFGGGREMGAGIGTFGDSVFLALFLVIAFAVAFSSIQQSIRIPRVKKIAFNSILILIVIALFFTYSRGSVLVALATIPVILYLSGGRKKTLIYISVGLVLVTPVILFGILGQSSSSTYINPKLQYTDPLANMTNSF